MIAFGIIACSMPEVFADYPQRHLLATSWALCFRKIYVYHIIIFVCLRSNYECKDTSFFCFSQIFFYLSQSVCEIFPCQCNHSLTRSSRHASCHLFYYLIIYSRSCHCLPCCSSILRLSLSAAVIFQQKNYWIKKRTFNKVGGVKNLYGNYLRSAETLSETVLINGVWIWAIRIVM